MHRFARPGVWAVALVAAFAPLAPAADTARALAALRAVSAEGNGNDAAGLAWKTVVNQGGAALLPTLEAMKGVGPTPTNWLRTAAEAIAEAERNANRPLPADKLEAFLKDTAQSPAGRRVAYELVVAADPKAADRLLPGFLNDPSLEIRRDAVAAALQKLDGKTADRTAELAKLFPSTRDKDQVDEVAKELEKAGRGPSLTEHFGFVTHWHVIGPFDSTGGAGYAAAYPPEAAIDLKAKLKGKGGAELIWKPFVTADRYGMLDLNKALGKNMDCCGYAVATLTAAAETPVEIRAGSQNAVQIFLNGKRLFQREEYHHGTYMDQHVAKGTLKAGPNTLLVKVCQNNQKDSWAQAWGAQVRLCDPIGGPLPLQEESGGRPVKLGFVPPELIAKEKAAKKEEKR